MTRTKNPFPTHATPTLEQIETVRGMTVQRTSDARWTKFLVQDPHDPDVYVVVEAQRTKRGTYDRETGTEHDRWAVDVYGQLEPSPGGYTWQREPGTHVDDRFHARTRREAESMGFAALIRTARALVGVHVERTETDASLLGLEAPMTVRTALARARRRKQ